MAGVFNQAVLTTKGIALLAKAQAGRCTINLTKAVSGNGSYSAGEDLASRTALKSQMQEFAIITNYPDAQHALATGYYVREIGLYATDPDEGEILYAIATAVTDQWDYMPSYNNLLPSTITIEMLTEVANASTVTIEAPNKMYLYDDNTGDKYQLGVENGILYFEEVAE